MSHNPWFRSGPDPDRITLRLSWPVHPRTVAGSGSPETIRIGITEGIRIPSLRRSSGVSCSRDDPSRCPRRRRLGGGLLGHGHRGCDHRDGCPYPRSPPRRQRSSQDLASARWQPTMNSDSSLVGESDPSVRLASQIKGHLPGAQRVRRTRRPVRVRRGLPDLPPLQGGLGRAATHAAALPPLQFGRRMPGGTAGRLPGLLVAHPGRPHRRQSTLLGRSRHRSSGRLAGDQLL